MRIISLSLLIFILFSCNNKNVDKKDNLEIVAVNNDPQAFSSQNISKVEMIHSIEYYKNEITKYEDNYYGFNDVSMEITQLMNISSIPSVEYIGNGFKILEVFDEEYLELSWNNYIWNMEIGKYIKQ